MGGQIKMEGDIAERHNPFQGMPDVAPVMLEILKEVMGAEQK